jgi:MYXO-CTERM domain-containing protein
MKTRLLIPTFLLAALGGVPSAFAANFYVTTTGNDGNPGNQAQPFRTIRKGVSVANPGDTVFISRGTYPGAVSLTRSGTSAAWITISALPGELPIIDGGGTGGTGFGSATAQFIRVVGIAVRNFASSAFGNGWVNDVGTSNGNWQFINCIADGNGINGITFYNSSGLLVDESIVAHNGNMMPSWSSGVNLFHVSGDFTTNVVRRTVSFENIDITTEHSIPAGGATDGSGFILDQNSSGALFENNIGFRNGGSCIRVNTPGAHLVNNTCWHNGLNMMDRTPANPGEIYFSSGPQGAVMVNNLAAASGWNDTMTAIVNGPAGTNNVVVNMNGATAFFTNPAAVDFRLTVTATNVADKGAATDAPATDIGFDPKCITTQTGQPVSWWSYGIDYNYIQSVGGIAGCFHPAVRPQGNAPDVGAYEFGGQLVQSDAGVSTGSGGAGGTGGPRDAGAGTGGSTGGGGATGSGGNRGSGGASTGGAAGAGVGGSGGNSSADGSAATGAGGGTTTGNGGSGTVSGAGGDTSSGVGGSVGAGNDQPGDGTRANGCACRAASSSRGAPGAWVVGLGVLFAARRRRRARSS